MNIEISLSIPLLVGFISKYKIAKRSDKKEGFDIYKHLVEK